MLYLGSDHGGFELKGYIKKVLERQKIKFEDVGAFELNKNDDYPDFAAKASAQVSKSPAKNQAILICRSGQGVCIAANKFKGVRAALAWNTKEAKASRNDDHTNVLCIPSDYITEKSAGNIITTWLKTPWSKEPRHVRRVKKISFIEKINS